MESNRNPEKKPAMRFGAWVKIRLRRSNDYDGTKRRRTGADQHNETAKNQPTNKQNRERRSADTATPLRIRTSHVARREKCGTSVGSGSLPLANVAPTEKKTPPEQGNRHRWPIKSAKNRPENQEKIRNKNVVEPGKKPDRIPQNFSQCDSTRSSPP